MTAPTPVSDPLSLVALDTERYVGAAGWDQNPRLFALAPTADLLAAEPQLAGSLTDTDRLPGALTAIEQEGMPVTANLESMLGTLAWPDSVAGCALAVERIVLPPSAERDLPSDPVAAAEAVAAHPERADVRLLVAVLRDGSSRCLLRQRAHDRDDAVATGPDLAPGLVHALLASLR